MSDPAGRSEATGGIGPAGRSEATGGASAAPRIVALGGGHGLYATLSAARRITPHVTAVVTVADDGGSSGRLRSEIDIVPPGDLRMALAALASDSPHGRLWATIIQHRFGGSGALAGHPIGNLLLAGLSEVLADPVAALDEVGRILGVKGRVLPMCPIALQIEADVAGLESDPRMSRVIRGQVAVATTPGKVRRVRLLPGDPPATRQAVDAVLGADLVVLGPGSWFTSVIPHVLVPGLAAALKASRARRALVLNLAAEPGETAGFSAERHLHVLAQHCPGFTVHDVIVDASHVPSQRERDQLCRTATLLDAVVTFADVARPGRPLHDPAKLAAALDAVRAGGNAPTATVPTVALSPRLSPTQRPAVSPTQRPAVSPTQRPAVSPTQRPALSPTERPALSPTERPALSPMERPAVSPMERPAVSPMERPAVSPMERPALSPMERPAPGQTER